MSLDIGRKLKDHSFLGNSMNKACKAWGSVWFVDIADGRELREVR